MSCDNTNVVILSSKDKTPVLVKNDNIQNIEFGSLPEGLITKPTLMWQISNNKAGEHLTEVSYLTKGLNWNADYVLISDKDDKSVDLSGWVTIDNRSGAGYKDASLKLIAGDVQRAEARGAARYEMMKMDVRAEPGFAEKAFFEYHMYTLQRRTTVKENQTKQISLLSASDIPVKKLFVYDPVDYYGWYWYHYDDQPSKEKKIKVKLELTNSKRSNLGMPLPRGKVKVYKKDSDGSLQFIGEDTIDHTPKDETIRLYLGEAFDVVGERKKTGYREDNSAQWAEESFEISLRNHKDSDIEVEVIEHLWRYVNWKIVKQSHQFTKKDATTVVFKIPVPKGGEVKVSYTVKYWW
jgi:hypothetical protein